MREFSKGEKCAQEQIESFDDECEPSRKVYQQRRETAELVSKDEIARIATRSRRDQAR
jgi:hypothetical protein